MRSRLLRLSLIPLWGIVGYYKSREDFPGGSAAGLICRILRELHTAFGDSRGKAAGRLAGRFRAPRPRRGAASSDAVPGQGQHVGSCALTPGPSTAGSCLEKGESPWDRPPCLSGGRDMLAVGVASHAHPPCSPRGKRGSLLPNRAARKTREREGERRGRARHSQRLG